MVKSYLNFEFKNCFELLFVFEMFDLAFFVLGFGVSLQL